MTCPGSPKAPRNCREALWFGAAGKYLKRRTRGLSYALVKTGWQMLFDEPTAARIGELWSSVSEASGARSNLWDESWDRPLAGFSTCYEEALKTQSPQAWRAVVVQGRALRAALEHHDGVEHRLYVAATRVTDAVDYAMDALAKDGRGLVMPEQVEQLIAKVRHLEQAVAEDRASRKLFEVEAKRTLDEVAGKIATAKKPLVHLENVTLNPKFSLISTTLAEVAEALTAVLQFIENRQLIERIRRAAEKVKQAGAEFFREVRGRFAAFRLPWKRTPAEDYLIGSQPPRSIAFLVRDGQRDREERRIPGAGAAFQDCWLERGKRVCGPEMLVVPSGEFMMGTAQAEIEALCKEYLDYAKDIRREGPQHKVTIATPFAVGRFPVTRSEFAAFVKETGHTIPNEAYTHEGGLWKMHTGRSFRNPGFAQDDNHPVVCVSWADAKAYANWLSGKTGKDYRLLSEGEWEYACRAGTSTPFWWGVSVSTEEANYDGNHTFGGGRKGAYMRRTVPVNSFEPNPWGLYQVHGNVWEWCEDCWNESYNSAPSDGSACTAGDVGLRLLRGGSCFTYPWLLRAAYRWGGTSGERFNSVGFRLARTLTP